MRCEKYSPPRSKPVSFTCGNCSMFYDNYGTLLEHLYWKHGTESQFCKECSGKKWTYAFHQCTTDFNVLMNNVSGPTTPPCCTPQEIITVSLSDEEIDFDSDSESSVDSNYHSLPERDSEFCYCGQYIEGSEMIGCDDKNCALEWYHYKCVGIITVPQGTWYCPECLKRRKKKDLKKC